MRGVFFLTATLALFVPQSALAQHWTAEEQEIVDLNQSCWDAWASEDLGQVRRTCNDHVDARGWYTPDAAPEIGWFGNNAERRMAAFGSGDEWIYWEIRPLSVRIFGDTALIHFWVTRTHEDSQGNQTTQTQKQLNIWQQADGSWTWIGGMAMPEGARVR